MNQSILSSIQAWCESLSWRVWAVIAAGILLFVLLMILLLRPVFTRRRMKRKDQEASAQQQQDLQAWRNIAAMAKGTDDTVKQSLSSQLRTIKTLFQQGLEMVRKSGRNRNSLPWFMMLGEPQSGKSELLKTADLSLKCSAAENPEEPSLPLRFWLGRGLVLDVSGRTFFDRWFNGSCAEWECIRKLLLKFHYKVPLNGIILAVPADALIADSEELTRKKVSLIAAELNGFLSGIGMILPFYVVVTKTDMVLGFREYFLNRSDSLNEEIFGWRNPEKSGFFDGEAFAAYFNGLKDKLHEGALAQMLLANGDESRLDLTAGIYLFPDEFARIRRNLLLYLNTLFGRRSWIDSDCAKLSGVYFTAARCGHVMLSPDYAESRQKPTEEAALVNKQAGPQHAFFVKDLFEDLIFANGGSFAFTHAGRIRRNIKKYVLCLLMAAASVWLALAAWNSRGQIRSAFEEQSLYYEKTAEYLEQGELRRSPLITASPQGEMTFCQHESLAGHPDVDRLIYFYESQRTPDKNNRVPWGLRLSQLLLFRDFDCDQPRQDFVSSRIQMEMVLRPTLQILLRHLVSPKAEKEPFGAAKRDVFRELHRLKTVLPDEHGHRASSTLLTAPYLRYLDPGLSGELVELLGYRAGRTSAGDLSVVAGIVYSFEYQKALNALTRQFLNAWALLAVDPDSDYAMLRSAIRTACHIRQNQEAVRKLAGESAAGGDPEQVMARLVSIIDQQNELLKKLASALASSRIARVLRPRPAGSPKEKKPRFSVKKREMTFQNIFAAYESRMEKDFDLIRRNTPVAASGTFPNSASVFNADMLEKAHRSARRRLGDEKKELTDKLAELKKARFFQAALTDQKNTAVQDAAPAVQIELEYLNMLIRTWKLRTQPIKSPAEFTGRLQALRAELTKSDKALAEYAARYASNKDISGFVKDCRAFILVRDREMTKRLERELFALYPASAELLMSEVARQSHTDPETLGMKKELAEESFAKLKLNNSFAPQTALAYAAPIGMLLGELKGKKKDGAGQPDPELSRIAGILDKYFDLYIRYWGSFSDKIPVGFDSWSAFRSDSMKRKAYQTNTLLLASYRRTCDFIRDIPDALLSKATADRKKLALTQLNNRIQILSPDFMQSCSKVCGAWAVLPADANTAFGILNTLPQKQLRTDYLLVFDAKAKGDIPWWSQWVSCGVSLLFRDAKAQLFKDFARYRPMIFSFPLCARPPYSSVLGERELTELSRYLASLGCPVPENVPAAGTGKAPQGAEKKPAASKPLTPPDALAQFFGNRPESLKEWTALGGRLQILIDALTNRVKPLVYTLALPSEAEQKNLSTRLKKTLPLAIYRFPYIRVSNLPKAADPKVFHLTGEAIPELLSGAAEDSQIHLEFNSFSNSTSPDCTVTVVSEWAILRLYLSEHSSLDPKTRKVYSALTLKDKTGKTYLLWLEFKFNKVLPLPSDWPSAENCPDFSQIQSTTRHDVGAGMDWMRAIRNAGTGEKGYNRLMQELKQHSAESFPECSLLVADSMQKAALETPYLEAATPDKCTRVFCYGKTQQVPLPLTAHRFDIRIFRFSDAGDPAYSCMITGPYALLRLLTAEKRKFEKSCLLVPMTLTSPDGKKKRDLTLKIRLGR